MTGGADADNFKFSTLAATKNESGTGGTAAEMAASHDIIKDFKGQLDTITFDTATGTSAVGTAAVAGTASITAQSVGTPGGLASFHISDDTLVEQITAVATAMGSATAGEAAVWKNTDGNSYMYVTDGLAGVSTADMLIELSGIQVGTGFTTTGTGLVITDIA